MFVLRLLISFFLLKSHLCNFTNFHMDIFDNKLKQKQLKMNGRQPLYFLCHIGTRGKDNKYKRWKGNNQSPIFPHLSNRNVDLKNAIIVFLHWNRISQYGERSKSMWEFSHLGFLFFFKEETLIKAPHSSWCAWPLYRPYQSSPCGVRAPLAPGQESLAVSEQLSRHFPPSLRAEPQPQTHKWGGYNFMELGWRDFCLYQVNCKRCEVLSSQPGLNLALACICETAGQV